MSQDRQDHAARLDQHEGDIRRLREGQDAIFAELKTQGSGINSIASALTEMKAQKGPGWSTIISTASQVALFMGAAVSAIVYVASNGQSPAQFAMEKRILETSWRIDRLERDQQRVDAALGWQPNLGRFAFARPPGTPTN